jgi:hypothetical protein
MGITMVTTDITEVTTSIIPITGLFIMDQGVLLRPTVWHRQPNPRRLMAAV